MSEETFVVVGGGLAGAKAAETLRQEGFAGRVVVLGAEPDRPYDRPPLSKEFMKGAAEREKVFLHDEGWYAEQDVDLRTGTTVAAIDRPAHEVVLGDGSRQRYDKLLIA